MTLLLLLAATVAMAQEANVKGWLQDRDTREGVPFVTVQLLKTDSTFVTGGISSDNGEFALEGVEAGKYIVKFTSEGGAAWRHLPVQRLGLSCAGGFNA